jgi:hypothetical protein
VNFLAKPDDAEKNEPLFFAEFPRLPLKLHRIHHVGPRGELITSNLLLSFTSEKHQPNIHVLIMISITIGKSKNIVNK